MIQLSPSGNFVFAASKSCIAFEAIYKGNKIICNEGYFQNHRHKLNNISKSSVAHSTLILNDKSASTFKKKNGQNILENGLK